MADEVAAITIVRQIDHVYVPLDDARTAFTFLTDGLNLPEAWPFADYGVFGSGGVSLGNVNLEVLPGNNLPGGCPQHPARVTGIAFEPALEIDELMRAFDRRGISHTPPMPYVPVGREAPFWTNVGFDVMEGTFVCKYHFEVAVRRKQLKNELDTRRGGALSVIEGAELVIGTRDQQRSRKRWSRLLNPVAQAANDL